MTWNRDEVSDWTIQYFTDKDLGPPAVTRPLLVVNDVVWATANDDYASTPARLNFLQGFSTVDGSAVGNIDIPALTGKEWSPLDMAVDQNGYIWVQGAITFSTSETAFFVLDPVTKTVVQSIETATPTNWNGRTLHFDPINNLMWAVHSQPTGSGIYKGISTVTYSVTHTITIPRTSQSFQGRAIDTDLGHLWMFWGVNNLLVYELATGTLIDTLTTTSSGVNSSIVYFPQKKVMQINQTDVEMWSTTTRTQTDYFTSNNTRSTYYSSETDQVYGLLLDGITFANWPSSYSYSDPTSYTIYSNTSGLDMNNTTASNVTYIGSTGDPSIYVRLYDSFNFLFYIHKIAFVQCTPRDTTIREITLCSTEDTSSSNTNLENYDSFNRELILDLNLQAFSVYDLAHNNDTYIRDYIEVPSYIVTFTEDLIYVGSELVTDTSLVNLTVTGSVPKQENRNTDERREPFKFIVTTGTSISIAEYKDYSFVDWRSIDGVGYGYNSYLLTGYELTGEMMRKKQAIYLKLYFDRTEDTYTLDSNGAVVLDHQSGCKVQSQWDWNNSADNGKWGVPFQGYRLLRPQPTAPAAGDTFTYGERVIVTKNKLRGRGHCLSLLFVPECGKDTKLLGWGLDMTGNTTS